MVLPLLLLAVSSAGCRKQRSEPEEQTHVERLTPADIAQRANGSIVAISVNDGESSGTGFAISDRYIVTNLHVVRDARTLSLNLQNTRPDGRNITVDSFVFATTYDVDLALLHVAESPLEPLALSDQLVLGEHVVAIGNPRGFERTISDGLFSGAREIDGERLLQISAPISPGSSGGPLFNDRGEVVGVTSASQTNAQNINWAIPAKRVKELLSEPLISVTLADLQREKNPKGGLRAQALAISCEKKVAVACNSLGFAYDEAKDGLARDYAASARLYKKACDLGHAGGCGNLGYSYFHGQGVRPDDHRGIQLSRASCERGVREACFNAGDVMEKRDAVRDLEKALEFQQKGCELGYESSCTAAKRLRETAKPHQKMTAHR